MASKRFEIRERDIGFEFFDVLLGLSVFGASSRRSCVKHVAFREKLSPEHLVCIHAQDHLVAK
jgi:hypothetical protein